ncbi:unnamed protein product [Knipowitschia caucasica]
MSKFNPPSEFNFTSPGEWPEWKQRFARYRLATKLNKENGEVQVCSLIYAMGSEAEKIFASFEFATEDDKKNYEGVLSKLDEYFIPRRNVIHERACFYQRNQLQGEKAEAYIRVLYELAENCDFSDKRDEHIRDRLVVGIKDKELSLKLQLTADLTLAHVIQQVRQSEEVAKQISLQASGPQPEMQVASVSAGGRRKVLHKKHTPHTERESPDCVRCGTQHYDKRKCPAAKSFCKKCNKKGHWARVCRTKVVNELKETTQYQFLGEVTGPANPDKWTVTLDIAQVPLAFKIDTGADASIIGDKTFSLLTKKYRLTPTSTPFSGPGGPLKCFGMFEANTEYKGESYTFPVYVIKGNSCLLSRIEAVKMGLVKRVEEVSAVFGTSGLLKTEPAKILLKDNAQPYAVHVARRVPLPLMPLVKKELQRLENRGHR